MLVYLYHATTADLSRVTSYNDMCFYRNDPNSLLRHYQFPARGTLQIIFWFPDLYSDLFGFEMSNIGGTPNVDMFVTRIYSSGSTVRAAL